jgi:hypothetical protein
MKNTTFRKLDPFPSSVEGGDTLLGPLEPQSLQSNTTVIMGVIHHWQNPLESTNICRVLKFAFRETEQKENMSLN